MTQQNLGESGSCSGETFSYWKSTAFRGSHSRPEQEGVIERLKDPFYG